MSEHLATATAVIERPADELIVLPETEVLSINGNYPYDQYWQKFARDYPDVSAEATQDSQDLLLHRQEMRRCWERLQNGPLEKRPWHAISSARSFYRTLGQHNKLTGAEPDLVVAYQLIEAYLKEHEKYPQWDKNSINEWRLEAASILVDLSRMPDVDEAKRERYRHMAIFRTNTVIEENDSWANTNSIYARMLHDDMLFDGLFQKFQASADDTDPSRFNELNQQYLRTLSWSVNKFIEAVEECSLYDLNPAQVDDGPKDDVDKHRQALRGLFYEWAYLIQNRAAIAEQNELLDKHIQHTTLRQDRAHDSYSGDATKLSDNYDIEIHEYSSDGEVGSPALVQLKVGEHNDIYRQPIAKQVLEDPNDLTKIINSVRLLQQDLKLHDLQPDEKEALAKYRHLLGL